MNDARADVTNRKTHLLRNGCLVTLAGFVVLAIIGTLAGKGKPLQPNDAAQESDRAATISSYSLSDDGNVMAMIIPSGTPAGQAANAAKDKCGTREFCNVIAWERKSDAARAMPMTDLEVEKQTFSYSLNRTTGHERYLWNCTAFADAPKENCLSR